MSSPLDGNGVAAAQAAVSELHERMAREQKVPGYSIILPTAISAYLASAAPSQTAVKPVAYMDSAGLPSPPVRFPKDMRDNPGKYGLTPLVPLSTLTAQAAALVAAEKERDDFRSSLATTIGKLMLAEARVAELEAAGNQIEPYLAFAIGPESPGYHPTMPSAVASFRATLARRLTHQEKNNGR